MPRLQGVSNEEWSNEVRNEEQEVGLYQDGAWFTGSQL